MDLTKEEEEVVFF